MDDTLADESGIPVLANSDDIPVHSTPIKGTKIPLPSTRHVMKTMHDKGQPSMLSEREISELPNIPEEKFSSSHKRLGQGQKVIDSTPQNGRKQHTKYHTDTERQNSDTIKDSYKSQEDEMLLASRQSTYRSKDSRGEKYSEKLGKQLHDHPRSWSDSNTQFNPSHPGHNIYDREDNLRSHVHSKHPRSHSEYDRASRQHIYESDYTQRRDLRPYSPNSYDRTPPRRNMETKSEKVQNEQFLPPNTNSSSDRHPNALSNHEAKKSTPPGTNPAPLPDNVNNKLLPYTNTLTSFNENTNAFSSYSFTSKENKNRSQRQHDRQLDLTPENNKTETDKDGSELTIVTTARLTPRTAEVSPLARRRVRAVVDAHGEKSGTSLRTLSTSVKQREENHVQKPNKYGEKRGTAVEEPDPETSYSEVETSTIQKQRQEIQLLVTELKDRDRELGDMMKSHEQQLLAWEQDRQRVNVLDKKCSQYEADLHSKSTQLHNAHVALKALKSKYTADLEEAEGNKATIARLIGETNQFKQQLKQYEDKCGMLQKTVQDLSNNVGRLQAREEELNTSLKLKEKDIMSATSQMKELSDRLRQLDTRCKECQDREKEAVKERNSWKQKYEDCTTELQSLTDAAGEKSKQISQLEGEIQSLRHHLAVLQKDANMREKCKDEVIESMRVKQERTDSQLKNFRDLYERQLRELSKLHLQLDTSKDIINKQHSLEDQQLSGSYSTRGNSRLSDRSPDRQRNNTVQTSRYRDTDIDVHNSQQHTQSSGYQTQVSVNQSELLESQSVAGTHLHFQPNRIVHNQELPAGSRNNNDYAKFDYLNVQSEALGRKERNNKDHAYLKPEISPKNVRYKVNDKKDAINTHEICAKRLVFDSEGAIGDHTHSPTRVDKSQNSSKPVQSELGSLPNKLYHEIAAGSPPRKDGYIVEQPETKVVSQEIGNQATADLGKVDDVEQTHGKDQGPYNNAYVFENRLCSFLEDIDDLDDSIWDEKGNISKVIPEVEASPASKLHKLLLESRMMIQSLEKTADSPTTKQVLKSETTDVQKVQTDTE